MRTEVRVPRLGYAMTEAVLQEWLIEDGQAVVAGEPLYAIEADKSVQEVEAPATGTLEIVAQPGEDPLPVGHLIGYIS